MFPYSSAFSPLARLRPPSKPCRLVPSNAFRASLGTVPRASSSASSKKAAAGAPTRSTCRHLLRRYATCCGFASIFPHHVAHASVYLVLSSIDTERLETQQNGAEIQKICTAIFWVNSLVERHISPDLARPQIAHETVSRTFAEPSRIRKLGAPVTFSRRAARVALGGGSA